MQLRGNKYWELLTDNEKECDQCGRTRRVSMRGLSGENKGVILCKRCTSRWGEAERRIWDEICVWGRFIRGRLISIGVILVVLLSLNVMVIGNLQQKAHKNNVDILTEWAYPKVNTRVSKQQVRKTVEAHFQYSPMPEHTLAIVMAESRFLPSAINTVTQNKESKEYMDVMGQGQVRKTVWEERLRELGIIENDARDLFDITVSAKAVSYILGHYFELLPNDLRAPGVKVVHALTMYNGHSAGKKAMRELVDRNERLTNKELKNILEGLDYPMEVLAYVGEMSALRQDTNLIKQTLAWIMAPLHKEKKQEGVGEQQN